jgi:hypothetical protein
VKNKRPTTTVSTSVNVREALERSQNTRLTHEEERMLRMRSGTTVRDTERLALKGQSHAETRAKLALIEQAIMAEMQERTQRRPAQVAGRESVSTKEHIIRRLRGED